MEPPTLKFIQQEQGTIEQFCENNYEDNAQECKMMIADTLQQPPGGGNPEPEPEPQAQPEPAPAPAPEPEPADPVEEAMLGEDVNKEIDALVADCVGGGFLGLHRPDMKSCMRVVAKHERDRR